MKFQILFGVFFAVLLVEVRSEQWDDNDEHCAKQLNLKREVLEPFEDMQFVAEDNDDFNKFLTCSWKRAGIINVDGKINWDKIDDHFDQEFKADFKKHTEIVSSVAASGIIDGAVQQCRAKDLEGNVPEQTAVVVRNCIAADVVRRLRDL